MIRENEYGYVIACDGAECNETIPTGKRDLQVALQVARNEGWIVRSINGRDYHYCTPECYERDNK